MTKFRITMIAILAIVFTFSSCNKDDDSCVESIWYEDADDDGFGNINVTQESCNQPTGFVSNSDDIDDTNNNLNPNTVWQGNKITFEKANAADWTQEANQDRITDNVWITRANIQGIFNIAQETEFDDDDYTSPIDTEWAIGTIADGVDTLTFDTWDNTHDENPSSLLNVNAVLHLITDDIYIDIKFLSWASGGSGGQGGFSYERSTNN